MAIFWVLEKGRWPASGAVIPIPLRCEWRCSMNPTATSSAFIVKNCALIALAAGERASSLLELRDKIAVVDESSIYYHFWGSRMHMQFAHPQHHNDFAHWVYHRLHDHPLAEMLNIIDPTEFENLSLLRQEILDTLEDRLDDYEIVLWTKKQDQFYFINSKIVIFESKTTVPRPEDLLETMKQLPPSSIFYHFIDARSRTPEKIDDFSSWLSTFGTRYTQLIQDIRTIDPFFLSLTQLKEELTTAIKKYM
jgi:hypothetical protein